MKKHRMPLKLNKMNRAIALKKWKNDNLMHLFASENVQAVHSLSESEQDY